MQRYGSVIKIKVNEIEKYKKLHANVWPSVLDMIYKCNIRNYSIFLRELEEGDYYLFSYFEYFGDNYDSDIKKMSKDSMTRKWWNLCSPCQEPLKNRKKGEWWTIMEEVFHCD